MRNVIIGSIVIIAMMWVLLTFHPIEGAATRWYQNLFAAVFVIVFGFLFVTVAGRISGLLGNSSNPISGMSIATLMATCAIFFLAGWTAPNYAVLALMIGGVVCIAAAIAGATSQDLKTGYLVGSTPRLQQLGLLVGVTVSTIAIGATLNLMNRGLERYIPTQIPVTVQSLPSGAKIEADSFEHQGKKYILINALGSHEIPDGEYLYDPGTQRIELQWAQGIGSDNIDLTAGRSFGKWQVAWVGFYSSDLNEPILGYQKQSQFAMGGLLGYDFGPVILQGYLTSDVYEKNYGGRDVRGWVGPSARRSYHQEKSRKRSQPRSSLLLRTHRRRRCLRTSRHHHQSLPGPGNFQQRAALAHRNAAAAVASRPLRLRAKGSRTVGDQQSFRRLHVPDARSLSVLLRPQKTGLT